MRSNRAQSLSSWRSRAPGALPRTESFFCGRSGSHVAIPGRDGHSQYIRSNCNVFSKFAFKIRSVLQRRILRRPRILVLQVRDKRRPDGPVVAQVVVERQETFSNYSDGQLKRARIELSFRQIGVEV